MKIKFIFENFCGYLLLLSVFINLAEVASRVVFGASFDLFFSFTIWIAIWAILLITGVILPEGEHLSIDFLRNKFKGRSRFILEVILSTITAGYGLFIAIGGFLFVLQLYRSQLVFPNYIAIPKWIVESCVPVSMSIFSAYAIIVLVNVFRKKW